MTKENIRTAKTKTEVIGGKEFRFQHPGVRWYMENSDNSRNAQGVMLMAKYAQNILDNVVISPAGLTLDDFKSVGELEELIQKAEVFLKS